MNSYIAVGSALVSLVFVIVAGVFAYKDNFLFLGQAKKEQAEHGYMEAGLAYIAHLGMWGDVFIVTPRISLICGYYSYQWTITQWIISLSIAVVVSLGMHRIYAATDIAESHAYNGHLTKAGIVHCLYMILVITVFVLFYFFTTNISPRFLVSSSVLIFIHVLLGTHIVWRIVKVDWYPISFDDPSFWIQLGVVAVLLAGRTWYILHLHQLHAL